MRLLIVLLGCNTSKSNQNSSLESTTFKDMSTLSTYSIEELSDNIQESFIGNRFVLGLGTIGNDGSILLGNVPIDETEDSILYLHNVEDGSDIELDRVKANMHFGYSYQDDEIIVYFRHRVWSAYGNPEEYYIYHKDTQLIEPMNVDDTIDFYQLMMIDRRMVRMGQDLYFEIQDREPIYEEDSEYYQDNGSSIYKYNLDTKEISFVIRGMSPRIYNGELIYINNSQEAKIMTMNGTEILDRVIDYYSYDDVLIAVQYINEDTCKMTLIKNGIKETIFDRTYKDLFWDVYTNGDFVTWLQGGSYDLLCFYDIERKSLVTISSLPGGSTTISEKYLHWSENLDPDDKFNGEMVIHYIKFD